MLIINCLTCGARLKGPSDAAGKTIACPKCAATIRVPMASNARPDGPPPTLAPMAEPENIGDDAVVRMLIPVGRSIWAIASGYLGLISVLLVPAPFALFTGIMAVREMKRNPKAHGMGRAIFGMIMGTLGTVGLFIVICALIVTKFK
jgi:DNA-directed RNA polymerase subunit RPC12/RpoP